MTTLCRKPCLRRCVMQTIDHARQQQLECAAYVISGGPDQRGALLGLHDWFAEEFLMEQEAHECQP